MIRTIKQRIYTFGLLPLGALAVSLVVMNGYSRTDDANLQLRTSRETTAALLQGPALDALVIGNTLGFDQAVKAVMRTLPALICVTLIDATQRIVMRAGHCGMTADATLYSPIHEPMNGFSDFEDKPGAGRVLGRLGLLMDDPNIERKRQTILMQLGLSLLLIAGVLTVTGRLLRVRLIAPIGRIGAAMQALSQRDYTVRVPIAGNDELTRLAEAINNTITTVAEYTRELERRRSEADQALQDADAANLARDGLVRSLTEDLADPMSSMHSQLMAMALANKDARLKESIKSVMTLLQDAQSDIADLIEIATHIERPRATPWLYATEMWADIEHDIQRLSETESIPIIFTVTQMRPAKARELSGVLLNLDGVRLKKATLYLVRGMGRRCRDSGVHVNAKLIRFSSDRIHASIHIVSFCGTPTPATPWMKGDDPAGNALPAVVGLTDRESKIVDYLLRAIGTTPTVTVAPTGTINVLLDMTCPYTLDSTTPSSATDWVFAAPPISATLISNDLSLLRYTTRGDMSNHELQLLTFDKALSATLQRQDALLIDISDDMAEVLAFLNSAKARELDLPHLIAICPPGMVSESLATRLFDLHFVGMLQKPLNYSRLIEVIRTTLSHPLGSFGLRGTFSARDDTPQ